jgi:hypothetical protein
MFRFIDSYITVTYQTFILKRGRFKTVDKRRDNDARV